jgi:hypothetical protein
METGVNTAMAAKRVRDFKDLEVWKAARELRRELYKMAKALSAIEKFSLASQIRRAAVSVTATSPKDTGGLATRRTRKCAVRPVAPCTS